MKNPKSKKYLILTVVAVAVLLMFAGVYNRFLNNSSDANAVDTLASAQMVGPKFNPDSAFLFCSDQCKFGPRTMNSVAHSQCADYIEAKFKQFGCTVIRQDADLKGYDGTTWHQPVMAANDGASGVAVMMEVARQISVYKKLNIGVDFICLDAEDWGTPQWSSSQDDPSTWALGAQYWSKNPHKPHYEARFGILLDMVGGQGAQFYREGVSKQYAPGVVDKVGAAAKVVGAGSYFPDAYGGQIIDDHGPINENAHIPTIDIIPNYTDCQASNFGPTWHTVSDDMAHIDKNTLSAVGQTLIQVIYSEK